MSEFEYAWLLILPLFFSFGWIAARIDLRQLIHESKKLPTAYFRGLTHLLNHENDAAVEALSQASSEYHSHFELAFSLGQLYRNRGQFDKAIALHQTLASRADLQAEQRLAARLALAVDYLKAGLYDRAEVGLNALLESDIAVPALQNLWELLQRERRWDDAISTAKKLELLTQQSTHKECAEFNAELAQSALQKSNFAQAQIYIFAALESNRQSVRARYLQGKWYFLQSQWKEAIQAWQSIQETNPAYVGLIALSLIDAYRALDQVSEAFVWLKASTEEHPTIDGIHALIPLYIELHGLEATQHFLQTLTKRLPSVSVAIQYWHHARQSSNDSTLDWIAQIFENGVRQNDYYLCQHCGFKAQQFYWQCPACLRWESYLPYRLEELPFHQ